MDSPLLLAFPLLLVLSTPCEACGCKIQHPQTFYCMSEVVIIADILGYGNDTKLKRGLKINITEKLKFPKRGPKINQIYTPKNWDSCGYEVRTSQQSQLLIAGYLRRGTLHFTRCHLYFWYKLTTEQRLGFRKLYRKGCQCRVQPCLLCWRACPQAELTECVWKQRDCDYQIWGGNESLYSMCVPSLAGRCEWTNIQVYQAQTQPPTSPETTPLILDIAG